MFNGVFRVVSKGVFTGILRFLTKNISNEETGA
jgi:hypothetical protein